jgi:hypothetical protein
LFVASLSGANWPPTKVTLKFGFWGDDSDLGHNNFLKAIFLPFLSPIGLTPQLIGQFKEKGGKCDGIGDKRKAAHPNLGI